MSTQKKATPSRRRRRRRARPREPEAAAPESAVPSLPAPEPPAAGDVIVTANPEPRFAARVPPPEPPRPLPTAHRAIFFDVENTSRPEHVARVLDHLSPDWTRLATELVAVGNWRVIGHETARILAQRGAHLVHSAPASGVRDWSDLRIAVAAGAWLAAARPGDAIEIISDDHAFDAVGDVAASLGVSFERLSYRSLAGLGREMPADEMRSDSGARRRRGGRRGRREQAPVRHVAAAPAANAAEPHGAPDDVIIATVRELVAASPAGVTLDALSNTLKARGFSRPAGSLRLITRLRRMKPLEVTRDNVLRMAEPAGAESAAAAFPESAEDDAGGATEMFASEGSAAEAGVSEQPAAANEGGRRRRRRRGGRRRRGRGRGGPAVAAAP